MYPPGAESVRNTAGDRDIFNELDQVILVVASRAERYSVLSKSSLRFLDQLDTDLQRLPGVEPGGVRSLAGLITHLPSGDVALRDLDDSASDESAALRKAIKDLPLSTGLLVADDASAAAIYVDIDRSAERSEVLRTFRYWRDARRDSSRTIQITGPVAAEATLGDAVLLNMAHLMPLMSTALVVLLWFSLRTIAGVLVPSVQVVLTLVCTGGIMGWLKVPINAVTTVLP